MNVCTVFWRFVAGVLVFLIDFAELLFYSIWDAFFCVCILIFFLISQCKGKCLTDLDFWLDKNDCPLSEFIALVCVCVCVFFFRLQLHFSVSFIELSVHTWMELTSHYVFYLSVFNFERKDNERFFETHNWCLTEREKSWDWMFRSICYSITKPRCRFLFFFPLLCFSDFMLVFLFWIWK